MKASSISTINNLSHNEKRDYFLHMIPNEVFTKFNLPKDMINNQGQDLIEMKSEPGSQSIEVSIYHEFGFQDPIIFCHLIDTLTSQIHVLLYIMNDPESPRFDTDRMPDGTKTIFGTEVRNLEAEKAAMANGLLPGQIRRGINLLGKAVESFEEFVEELGHRIYFVEPLYYHNAITFERYGFNYQSGRRRMEKIHQDFRSSDRYTKQLSGSPFRNEQAANSLFYRSWAIHDGTLDEPFTYVTMYKMIGKKYRVNTAPGLKW